MNTPSRLDKLKARRPDLVENGFFDINRLGNIKKANDMTPFERGFIKAAQAAGLSEGEAVDMLKHATDKDQMNWFKNNIDNLNHDQSFISTVYKDRGIVERVKDKLTGEYPFSPSKKIVYEPDFHNNEESGEQQKKIKKVVDYITQKGYHTSNKLTKANPVRKITLK